VARRAPLQCAVAAAIVEVGSAEACLLLLENPDAEIAIFSIDRMVERFGHVAAIREALFERDDLPATTRHALVAKLSSTLADFVTARAWLEAERAHRVAQEACEKATVVLAAESPARETRPLIRHLCQNGQLTAGLILRALLSGNVNLFEEALAELSGLPVWRVRGYVHDNRGAGFRAVYDKAGLPASTWPAFRSAIEAMREVSPFAEPGGASRLKRRMIERVLTGCEKAEIGESSRTRTRRTGWRRKAGSTEGRSQRSSCGVRGPRQPSTSDVCGCWLAMNSSHTWRSVRVSWAATASACGRPCSRMMARTASTCWSTRSSGTRAGSCVSSINRHRLSATAATSGKPSVAACPLMSWAERNSASRGCAVMPF
jgi:hypothetical protein